MAKINDKYGQLARWLSKLYPPSSPQYTQPSEMSEGISLVQRALPPSVLFERLGIFGASTVNPATELFSPSSLNADGSANYLPGVAPGVGVPLGKFLWVLAAHFSVQTALPSVAGRAFIGIKQPGITSELFMGSGFFSTATFDHVSTHVGIMTGNISNTITGGGGGPFIVPPGYQVHFSNATTPAATTVFNALILLVECTIGEEVPGRV